MEPWGARGRASVQTGFKHLYSARGRARSWGRAGPGSGSLLVFCSVGRRTLEFGGFNGGTKDNHLFSSRRGFQDTTDKGDEKASSGAF